jgi:hypothetical protein
MTVDPQVTWPSLARRLRLRVHEHGPVPEEDSFAALWGALGSAIPHKQATARHWLAGSHHGRRVVLRASASWAAHVVEVDPPLWLGLRATRARAHATALDGFPEEWLDTLSRQRPEARAVTDALRDVEEPWDATLVDSLVQVGLGEGSPVPGERWLEGLDKASTLATAVETLRDAIPPAPWRSAMLRECEELAGPLGLELDAPRLTLSGRAAGMEVASGVVLVRRGAALERRVRAVVRFGQQLDVDDDARARARGTLARVAGGGARIELDADRTEAWVDLSRDGGGMRAVLEGAIEVALELTGRGPAPTPYR